MPELPGRPDFWNISYPLLGTLVYLTLPIAVTSIDIALYKRYRIWRLGKPTPYMGPWTNASVPLLGNGDSFSSYHRDFLGI